jgi:hypothetical protein
MVRLESGHTVAVNADLQGAYGGTPDGALLKIEAAREAWVNDQT